MSEIVQKLREQSDMLCLEGADPKNIEAAESRLSVKFAEEYREYTREFGAINIDGRQITGVNPAPDLDVVSITEFAREGTPEADSSWYVICDTHIDALLYWQDHDGKVYRTFPGESPVKVADSLVEFLQI